MNFFLQSHIWQSDQVIPNETKIKNQRSITKIIAERHYVGVEKMETILLQAFQR